MSASSVRKGQLEIAKTPDAITKKKESFLNKLYGALLMTVQKANTPSVTLSPAVVTLALSLVIQTVVVAWWASGTSKDVESNKAEIRTLKSELETQKVYIDTTREKFIEMKVVVESIQREKQLEQMLKNREKEK